MRIPTHSLKTVVVCAIALATGACAARAVTHARPASPIVVTAAAYRAIEQPNPEISVLPVGELRLDLMASPSAVIAEIPEPRCDIAAVVASTASDPVLKDAPIAAGTKLYRYTEVRVGAVRKYKDYEKDVALRILDLESCTTQVVTVTKTYGTRTIAMPVKSKKGTVWKQQVQPAAQVKSPRGWDIEVMRRANGIEWNNWATVFQINSPTNHVVVGVKYPIVEEAPGKGKPRITEFTYVPHSEELMQIPELVASGPTYGDDIYSRASALLRTRGVMSKAMPRLLVSDVAVLTPAMSFRRIANEHMDQLEFTLNPNWTTRRIFMVIGANGDQFGIRTCSPEDACGPRQFIPGTWSLMASVYPKAQLEKKFTTGASNALESTMASILLDDFNLAALIDEFGLSILDDPQLEEYLTAAYNTGVGRVIRVLRIARSKNILEWTEARGKRCSARDRWAECLLPETKGYIVKNRYLKEEWPNNQPLAVMP